MALGWQHRAVEENARQIGQLGRECYKRLKDFTAHLENAGKYLGQAVGAYNQAVGSFERRVLVSARRFDELDTSVFTGDATAPEGDTKGANTGSNKIAISEIDSLIRMPKVDSKDAEKG